MLGMKKAKRPLLISGLASVMLLGAVLPVSAFSDIDNDPNGNAIRQLEKSGIIGGSGNGQFKPAEKLTYAEGISLIVKAFDYNLNTMKFIRMPEASQYFPGMNDQAWYAPAFLAAAANGMRLPKDLKPGSPLSREQLADLIAQGIQRKGEYMMTQEAVVFADESAVAEDFRSSVQLALKLRYAKLDGKQQFNPKTAVTRSDAAAWIQGGMDFVDKMKEENGSLPEPAPSTGPLQELTLTANALNDKVQEVKVTAQAPHPGYGLEITSIEFSGAKAYLTVKLIQPKPGQMYPQVITEVSAVTYIGAKYAAELRQNADDGASAPTTFRAGILPGKNAR